MNTGQRTADEDEDEDEDEKCSARETEKPRNRETEKPILDETPARTRPMWYRTKFNEVW